MQGKTHFVVGIAAALAVCRPATWSMLIAGTGTAAAGGMISDIDSGSSSAHRDADRVSAAVIGMAALTVIADVNMNLGIYARMLSRVSQPRIISVAALFIAVCAYGKSTKHRTFMHSIPVGALLGFLLYLLLPELAAYFVVAFASHLLLDLLNRRKVQLFWPIKRGFCVCLCNSAGWVNRMIGFIGLVCAVLLIFGSEPVRETGFALQDLGKSTVSSVQAFLRSL